GAEADVNRQHHGAGGAPVDWLCVVNPDTVSLAAPDGLSPGPIIEWKLGSLRDDEIDAVLRFHVLHTDTELRETFAEHLVSAVHSHSIAIDKIWRRIYLQDSVLVIDGFEYNLTD